MTDSEKTLLPFHSPSVFLLNGPSMSGKTTLMSDIIKHADNMFEIKPDKIIYAYTEYQDLFDDMLSNVPRLIMHQGLPSTDQIDNWSRDTKHIVLILDDLAESFLKSPDTLALVTTKCHHKCISVFWLSQNLFMHAKHSRGVSLNTHYIILFKSPRDKRQALSLASQIYPGQSAYFMSALQKAHTPMYGYLCIDLSPASDDRYRLRTKILPGENTIVYVPR